MIYCDLSFTGSDSILTKYEAIVLDAHDTIEDVISGILNDDDEEDDHMDTIEEEDENMNSTESCQESND